MRKLHHGRRLGIHPNTPSFLTVRAEVVRTDPAVAPVSLSNDKEIRRAVGRFDLGFRHSIVDIGYAVPPPPGYEHDGRAFDAWSPRYLRIVPRTICNDIASYQTQIQGKVISTRSVECVQRIVSDVE